MPDRGEYQIYIVQASVPEEHAEFPEMNNNTAKHDWDGVGNTSVDEARFKNDGHTWVWRRRGEKHAACCLQPVRSFHGGSVIVWAGISDTGKTPMIILDGNLNAHRYIHEILISVALPFITNMGGNAVLQAWHE